ncbi:bifunctional methylenetetrahydrofolate dehydrogenase/methenyltetrahydrofolate cyclohydrolase FolD [Bacillus fonticola]|uniref:bifunctional methylenetetrahydrofolate dehydrogenase/methenyltetrahydrofolate cyclohydrolase FolD n=1 Tax=Bacillus fonticola TaxID=2728853 RepID=UPI001472AA9D|nr:bifunctional methylenetetrahydrofolate dehydrogenase/methenyltetrahydrofolate cyclohydrolase FolD [Bacillus fonticola]
MQEAQTIDGKAIAGNIRAELQRQVEQLKNEGITPSLAVILLGDDPASTTYVSMKEKACKKMGIHSTVIRKSKETTQQELLDMIAALNADDLVDGILVQLPLPDRIDEQYCLDAISPEKDVDGFHPVNVGRMMSGQDAFLPCTPFGVMKLLEAIDFDVTGKHAVVIGRSGIVGKPMGQLLLAANATVTMCHSKTVNLRAFTKQADVVISAIGRPKFLTSDYFKEGAVVIDVGTSRAEDGKLSGDVDFDDVKDVASYLTPVPGGVGPMTITMLLHNTVTSAKRRRKK